MENNNWIIVGYIFISTIFFSAMSWMNVRSKSDAFVEGRTPTKVKIEGVTHSIISSLVAVVVFAALSHYVPSWELLFRGAASVAGGALFGETLIKFAARRINNDKLI